MEYDLIYNRICGDGAPSADLIEQVGYSSQNPLFKKAKFRKALMEYREYGLYCGRPKKPNAAKEVFYIRLRRNINKKIKGGGK